jgi:acyl carrier protein
MRRCSASDEYRLGAHPGFIDACLQLFYAALPFGTGEEIFLFSSASRIRITGPLAGCYTAHARLDNAASGGKVLLGSMFVSGEDGLPVIEMAGVEMRKTSLDIIGRLTARPSGSQARPESQRMEFVAGSVEIRRRLVESVLVAELESALGERLTDPDMPLTQLGVDSIIAMELRAALSARLGADVPTVAFIDGTALNGLIEKVVAAPESAAAAYVTAGFSEDRI